MNYPLDISKEDLDFCCARVVYMFLHEGQIKASGKDIIMPSKKAGEITCRVKVDKHSLAAIEITGKTLKEVKKLLELNLKALGKILKSRA